jgi:hypothetical protein
MESVATFLPIIPVLLTAFGVLKKKRFFFLLGYTLYSLMVVTAELYSYASSGDFSHFMIASLFFAQLIIAFPNKLNDDGSKVFTIKLFLCLVVINIIGVLVVLNDPIVNDICAYYHALLAFLPIVVIFLMLINRIPVQENK